MKEVLFEEGCQKIAAGLFANCLGLERVEIPDSVTTIGEYAFYNCDNLKEVIIPDSVTVIEDCAFSGCSHLSSVVLPDNLNSIGNQVFGHCSSLEKIVIPKSVTSMAIFSAFPYCNNLTTIEVEKGNANYCAEDGILFDKEKKTLISYPAGKVGAYSIPETVTTIGRGGFAGCEKLTEINMSDSVSNIGNLAFNLCTGLESVKLPKELTEIRTGVFYYCTSLRSIKIPASVNSIEWSAFGGCNLSTIFYGGTEEQWAQISIDEGNDALYNALIIPQGIEIASLKHVDEEKPTFEYGYWGYYVYESVSGDKVTVSSSGNKRPLVSNSPVDYYRTISGAGATTRVSAFNFDVNLEAEREDGSIIEMFCNSFLWQAYDLLQRVLNLDGSPVYTDQNGFVEIGDYIVEYSVDDVSVKIPFSVTESDTVKDIRKANVEIEEQTYTGEAITPLPVVTYNGTLLTRGKDYIVSYKNNIEVGTAIAIIKGINGYSATLNAEYIIINNFAYGDANGDEVINTKDVIMLRQYLASKDPVTGVSTVEIKAGGDVNGDEVVNTKDIIMLRRYLAARNPVTGESSVVLGPTA